MALGVISGMGPLAGLWSGTQPHPRSAVLRPDTMNTTHDKYAGGGFEAEFGALAASTMNSFDRHSAHCRDSGCSGGQ